MAPRRPSKIPDHIEMIMYPVPETRQDSSADNETSASKLADTVSDTLFKKDSLDRKLERHHITGIAFSGAVGIGFFEISSEIIALGGPVGAIIAYIFAGLVILSVLRCIAEMVSVRPVKGPLMDFPHTFVDEALGFAVGIMYWLANCMSCVTLTISAAMFTQYWPSDFSMPLAVFMLLLAIFFMNACGVQLYGNMEWVFKWMKILLLVALCIVMIAIKAGAGSGRDRRVDSKFEISPGYSPTGFFAKAGTSSVDRDQVAILGTGGRILAVWTCTTLAMFQFMGGEIVLVTAGEAKRPRRDLPTAARYMYLLPVGFYLVAILLVGLNVNYLDPRIYHSHISWYPESEPRLDGIATVLRSPFVIAIKNAGIKFLPGFLDACFIISAMTAANSALYVSSRTLFVLAQRSKHDLIVRTLGRTNNGHTPLAAIFVSFLPGLLAFLAVKSQNATFQEPIHVFGRLYTGSVLCIYGSECIAFLRFKKGLAFYHRIMDRDGKMYKLNYYRAHWQPLWAYLGLLLSSLLMIFSGWAAIYDLVARSDGVNRRDAIVDLVAAYLGPALFFCIYLLYKWRYKTQFRGLVDMRDVWFPANVPDEDDEGTGTNNSLKGGKGRFREFLSWIR
ncbi:MAG: Cationic amino acid transporter 2 [Heterodermia speciosa]|uniref:Cationic amino acid transporter 2 n=1 Tax=Heterodermia speciosa TaxID=116794 RepID=A0A8H3FCH0_9LECA|nr:MAG: Cationic amino acid transporter 2 [Heterodermia speciosa]